MSVTAERQHTNPQGFPEVSADRFRPMRDRILLQWEDAKDEINAGKVKLIRPETHKKAHYTGIVIRIPLDRDGNSMVAPEIKPGARIFFEQFAGFEKWFDPKYGRMALIREGDALCVLPKRVKVTSDAGGYDYAQ